MIINTKTGLLVSGTLSKDPELRQVGSSSVLKLSVRYGSEPSAEPGGKRTGKFLDVDIWDGVEELDGMLTKGDIVIATGDELKSREYGGKTYYSLRANGLFPSAGVVFRWMQQIVDMIPNPADFASADQFAPVDESTPFDAAPAPQPIAQQTTLDPLGEAPIEGEVDDLPF